jgi:hypothetical protein
VFCEFGFTKFYRKTPTPQPANDRGVIFQRYERLEMNASTLIWGVIFGSIGLGFFVYGKKQKAVIPLLSGIGLMIFPYFISNLYILILSGTILVALPFFIKI